MQEVDVEEDYILVIDADMIMRSPFFPKAMGVAPGGSPLLACQKALAGRSNPRCAAKSKVHKGTEIMCRFRRCNQGALCICSQ